MPDSVSENNEVKLLWDMNIQRDHVTEVRTPDIVVVNKQDRKCAIVDTAVPEDKRIGEKENEKVEKYQELKRQIARMWNMRTVRVIPIVIRSLGKVTKNLDKWLEKLYSLYVFSLAKSLQLILKISATYKLVSYLLADK